MLHEGSLLITFGLQVHAEIEFELLEGAELARKTLNGLTVQGQAIKVTPPLPSFSAAVGHAEVVLRFMRVFSRCKGLFMSPCWTWI